MSHQGKIKMYIRISSQLLYRLCNKKKWRNSPDSIQIFWGVAPLKIPCFNQAQEMPLAAQTGSKTQRTYIRPVQLLPASFSWEQDNLFLVSFYSSSESQPKDKSGSPLEEARSVCRLACCWGRVPNTTNWYGKNSAQRSNCKLSFKWISQILWLTVAE